MRAHDQQRTLSITSPVATGTSNNQLISIKSGTWWNADTTLSMSKFDNVR